MDEKDKIKAGSSRKIKAKTKYRKSSRAIYEEEVMGKSKTESLIATKERKKRERWLLTRKTWRYMADAGRKLIPDGALNRPEDIPKIEAYFQEVCQREPRFLLWRKQSYPGALGFRNRGRSRGGRRKFGGSCRDRTSSADEADDIKQQSNEYQDISGKKISRPTLLQLKQEFLFGKQKEDILPNKPTKDALVDNVLSHFGDGSSKTLDHQELLDKLTAHLAGLELKESQRPRSEVQDCTQQQLIETLRRYYSRSTNRDKVISDILTDRRLLHRLYFELRKTRGFIGGRPGNSNQNRSSSSSLSVLSRPTSLWRRDEFVEEDEDGDVGDEASPWSNSPPEVGYNKTASELGAGTQTEPISPNILLAIEAEIKKQNDARKAQELLELQQQQQEAQKQGGLRRSSVDNDDISPSVSDTIKRYLRMARKKSIDSDKADRFKRVNYDRNLRNIKAKPEDPISKDEDFDKGCQTDDTWVSAIKELKLPQIEISLQSPSEEVWSDTSPPPSSKSFLSSGQTFLSNLFHGIHHSSSSSSIATAAGAMQKSKSSSSVVQQGSRLVSKWKMRSKSQTRAMPTSTSTWTPQGHCMWTNVTGRTVVLEDTSLLQLSDIERKVLQKVALAKLQALNLGVSVRAPSETVANSTQKPKRRAQLLKRKAITTGFFDGNRKDSDKDGGGSGLVFGIPLNQCVENERAARLRTGAGDENTTQLRRKSQYGSRTSFTSLIETARSGEERGSCESLISPTLSMPGLLDSLSCGSTQDLTQSEAGVPNIVTTCLQHLQRHGLHTEGIFRVSSSKKRVRQLREDFDCGKEDILDPESCPHDVATLLKEYFRDLPDSLLCKDLYAAFIQTQKIRNRRLQKEAIQNLLFLLPAANRDTLWALLDLLSKVSNHSSDFEDSSGQFMQGNKMDSSNLATLFAPNILHGSISNKSIKDEMSKEKKEERSDAINVVCYLIDNFRVLYQISAEILNEVYIHMMDTNPELLDVILRRKDILNDELVDEQEVSLVSEDISERLGSHTVGDSDEHVSNEDNRINKERRIWSREAFTHEKAGMGGPDRELRPRYKDRGRDRLLKKRIRDESSSRRRGDSDTGSNTPSRRASTGQGSEDYTISDHINSSRGSLDSGAITAILKIPVPTSTIALNLDDTDIPFIEDNEKQQISFSMVRTPSSSTQRNRSSSDSSQASTHIHQIQYQNHPSGPGYDSAVGSSAALSSPPRITTPSASSYSSGGVYSSPPSWASTPPTSPDGLVTNINYIPEEPTTARISIPTKKSPDPRQVMLQRVTVKTTGEVQHVKTNYIQPSSVAPDTIRRRSKDGTYQRLLSTGTDSGKVAKSASSTSVTSSYPNERIIPIIKEGERTPTADRKASTSISNIGGAVLRSKTADIERMIKTNASKVQSSTKKISTASNVQMQKQEEDKKQTKRRYTDARHQTKHLPSEITGESSSAETTTSTKSSDSKRSVIWKRRELISSEPKERRSYL